MTGHRPFTELAKGFTPARAGLACRPKPQRCVRK